MAPSSRSCGVHEGWECTWRRSESQLTSTRWLCKGPFLLLRRSPRAPSWGYSYRITRGVRGRPRRPAPHGCIRSGDARSVQAEETPRTLRRSRDSPVSLPDSNPCSGPEWDKAKATAHASSLGAGGGPGPLLVRLREGSDVVTPATQSASTSQVPQVPQVRSNSRCKGNSRTQLGPGSDLSLISVTRSLVLLVPMVGTAFSFLLSVTSFTRKLEGRWTPSGGAGAVSGQGRGWQVVRSSSETCPLSLTFSRL